MSATPPRQIRVTSSASFILSPELFPLAHFSLNISGPTAPHWSARSKYDQTSEDLQTIPYRLFVEWALHFPSSPFSRRLRHLHLAARPIQRLAISLGPKLAVHFSTLDRPRRLRVYRVASLHRTLGTHGTLHLRHGRQRFPESSVSWRFLLSAFWLPHFIWAWASGIFSASGDWRPPFARNAPPGNSVFWSESSSASWGF